MGKLEYKHVAKISHEPRERLESKENRSAKQLQNPTSRLVEVCVQVQTLHCISVPETTLLRFDACLFARTTSDLTSLNSGSTSWSA